MEMNRQAFIDMKLGEYERRFTERDFLALSEAVEFCHLNSVPMPGWASDAVLEELHAALHSIGPRERGLGRGHADRAKRQAIQKQRAGWAAFFLSGGLEGSRKNRKEAFERAALELRGTPAQGEPEQIERAYNAERRAERLRENAEKT